MAKRQGTTEVKSGISAEQKALNNAISQIEKTFGSGAIMKLGEGSHMEVEGISTGALSLDLALGGKGLPRGRIIELFGPESSGKTTIALHAVGQSQRDGGVAAFIDVEHALDPSWCKRLGVDIESLLVSQPSSAEEAFRSPRCWSCPTPWISWSSTRWRRWCPRRKSKGRSVTASWDFRLA